MLEPLAGLSELLLYYFKPDPCTYMDHFEAGRRCTFVEYQRRIPDP